MLLNIELPERLLMPLRRWRWILYQGALVMAHRDRVGGSSGRRKVEGDAVHSQNVSTPTDGRLRDRNGGLPRLSDGVAHALRCPASPQRTLLAENLGKPFLWVMTSAPWY